MRNRDKSDVTKRAIRRYSPVCARVPLFYIVFEDPRLYSLQQRNESRVLHLRFIVCTTNSETPFSWMK